MLQVHGRLRLIGLITAVWVICVSFVNAPLVAYPGAYAQDATYTPVFEPGECVLAELRQFAAEQPDYAMECGFLVVPEDRSQPQGNEVRLPVVIFRTQNPDPAPDPLIYLAGGGGYNQMADVLFYLEQIGDEVLKTRDFIQYSQRGAPLTEPELVCPGHSDLLWSLIEQELPAIERAQQEADHIAACQQALIDQGVNLALYNSAVNAADAHDLRIALGYDEANYYGTSYGTRLGLTLIRDYPDGVRSIILDSVYPPQVDYYAEYTPNTYRALALIFAACAADPACAAKYPDLEATYFETVDLFNERPVTRRLNDRSIRVNGYLFMEAIDLLTYSPNAIAAIPMLVTQARQRDLRPLDGIIEAIHTSLPESISWAMFYGMQCQEEIPFEDRAQVAALAADLPPQIAAYWPDRFAAVAFGVCDQWPLSVADSVEREPVVSAVPALVLAGEFDPITSPAWSKSAADYLPNSFYLEFAGQSHGVMRGNDCALSMGLAFLEDPTTAPAADCMDDLPPLRFQ